MEQNLIEDNELRGSEGLGIVVEEGRRNTIIKNEFRNLPGLKQTFTPFPGTAIFLGRPTRRNAVVGNEFENVVNAVVDLGIGNVVDEAENAGAGLAAGSETRRSATTGGSRWLGHPKLRFLRDRIGR